MNEDGLRETTTFPGGADPDDWVIRAVGDVNGDFRADLVWRNKDTGGDRDMADE